MGSLSMAFAPPAMTGRVYAATAEKRAGGRGEGEKGLWDWIIGWLQKEEQLLETDPILKKVEGKTSGGGRKNSVAVPPKKKNGGGGFGGLFAKK